MKRILFAVFLGALLAWGCVEKKTEGSGLPTPQVGVAADTATATKKELPPAEIELPESLAAGESPAGGTVPPRTDTTKTQPVPTVPPAPSYVPEKKAQKLELLDFGEKKGNGKKSNGGGGSSKATRPKEDPKRPAEYSAPTVIPKAQSAPLPVAQGATLTAGQLSSWQTLVRNVNEKTSVPSAVVKIIPRKGAANANKPCSDAAQALLFSYKYLVLHGDEVNARKWYNKYKTFSCADGSALLGTLIAADQRFAAFVTK